MLTTEPPTPTQQADPFPTAFLGDCASVFPSVKWERMTLSPLLTVLQLVKSPGSVADLLPPALLLAPPAPSACFHTLLCLLSCWSSFSASKDSLHPESLPVVLLRLLPGACLHTCSGPLASRCPQPPKTKVVGPGPIRITREHFEPLMTVFPYSPAPV